jgi:hypothetical protein
VVDVVRQHHKVAIRVLHEDFYLACLTITCFAPNLSGSEVYRPIHRSELSEKGIDLSEVNLEHRALPEWMLHWPRLEPAMTLTKHDLLALRMLKVDELLFVAPVSNIEPENVYPEGKARAQVRNMKLRYDVRPGLWRNAPIHLFRSI